MQIRNWIFQNKTPPSKNKRTTQSRCITLGKFLPVRICNWGYLSSNFRCASREKQYLLLLLRQIPASALPPRQLSHRIEWDVIPRTGHSLKRASDIIKTPFHTGDRKREWKATEVSDPLLWVLFLEKYCLARFGRSKCYFERRPKKTNTGMTRNEEVLVAILTWNMCYYILCITIAEINSSTILNSMLLTTLL